MITLEGLSLVYERDYQWLVSYLDELGFVRVDEIQFEDQRLIEHYTYRNKELSLAVKLDCSSQGCDGEVLRIQLCKERDDAHIISKDWYTKTTELDAEKLKSEIKEAFEAFCYVKASFADYDDDNESVCLFSESKPILRGEEYYIGDKETWLYADTLGELFIKTFRKGNCFLYDVRPVVYQTDGTLWKNGYGGLSSTPLSSVYEEWRMKERVANNESTIYPWEDVNACIEAGSIVGVPEKGHLSCPVCGRSSDELKWIYFESPSWTWKQLMGIAGYMSICEKCHWQVEFICTAMN